jgi:vancomycin permeability regulator SanA
MYATVKVLTEAAINIGITKPWICFAEYAGLRTLTIVGANKVHE